MINTDVIYSNMIDSPVRKFTGRVELYEGSTLTLTCGCHDHLKDFSIERLGEDGKFFGFGICQKMNVHLIDKNREIFPQAGMIVEVVFGIEEDYMYPFPKFYITETHRDEKTNELSITAYDSLYAATAFFYSELELQAPYTLKILAAVIAAHLGLPLNIDSAVEDRFARVYPRGGNFEGDENLRTVLNAIAEATQTVFYVNHDWELTFKQLDRDGDAVLDITKDKYFALDSGANRRLQRITSTTELGDNVTAATTMMGSTQYIRDNPLLEGREDIATILNTAIAGIGNMTINTFDCDWRGNFLLEIGDKFNLTTKDGGVVHSYLLNDTLIYDGVLSQHSLWNYTDNSMETAANPTSLGDALNHTFARVDKIDKRIDLVASESTATSEKISQLTLTTDEINASVSSLQSNVNMNMENVNRQFDEVYNELTSKMTSEEAELLISQRLSTGLSSITTTTGFTFNADGLTVSKSNSSITTQITEDGMRVYRNADEVLRADNEGVIAEDLHATTYLMIGLNSRFEDYNDTRTACFWVREG